MTITGNRFKRSEGIIFKILYEVHKILTLVFTGKLIKFGNFSCLPKIHVEELIKNHIYGTHIQVLLLERLKIGLLYLLQEELDMYYLQK